MALITTSRGCYHRPWCLANIFSRESIRYPVSIVPTPNLSDNELCVRVTGAGVNFVDTLYARGKHQNNRSLVRPPFTLGLEFSGVVVSAPPRSRLKPGDRVFGDAPGSYAEYVTLSEAAAAGLRKVPPSWSLTDAAGLGATLPVSYGALKRAGLQPGETVLIHSAAGGLGIMAVQIAAALGCRVIGTTGSDEKCAYATGYGASVCFNYSEDKWWEKVLDYTDGVGAHVVFDPVGVVDLSLKCIAHMGRLLSVGFAGREGDMEKVAVNRLLLKQVSLIGYRYGETLRRHPEEKEQLWGEIEPLIAKGAIRPTVFKCYRGLESVAEALTDLSDRKVMGKAVIQVSDDDENDTKAKL